MDGEVEKSPTTKFSSPSRETTINATPSAASSSGSGDTPKNQRLRIEKKHRLPPYILQKNTDEEINKMFDADGYLLDKYRHLTNNHTVCRVCQNYAKHFCSQCRKIAYCSPACQKSHWKAHKPMCLVTRLRNPVDETEVLKTISLEDKDNEEFISQTTNYDEMCGYGRTYPNVQSMITDWLRLCTFRIVISYGAPGNDRVLDVARAAGGVFVLNFKYILTEGGRDVKPRKQKQVLPSRIEDVESYIVQEIETLAMKSPNTCILIESGMRDHPNDAIEAGEMPVNTVVRSAQASWEASRGWEVFQHEPERLRKFELSRYGTLHVQQRTYMW